MKSFYNHHIIPNIIDDCISITILQNLLFQVVTFNIYTKTPTVINDVLNKEENYQTCALLKNK